MHDPAGEQSEDPGDHQCADKQARHRPAMPLDVMSPRAEHRKRQHDQREQRQQMNGAPRPPQPDRVNEERADDHGEHQRRPDPAEQAVGDRPLRRGELDRAKREGAERGKGVPLDERRRGQQRSERHLWSLLSSQAMTSLSQVPAMNERIELASNSTSSRRLLTRSPILTIPHSRPLATTGKWRMRRLVISAISAPTVSLGSQVMTVRVMMSETGRDGRSSPSSARAITISRSERMPSTPIPSSLTTIAPMRSRFSMPIASPTVASGRIVATQFPLLRRIVSTFMANSRAWAPLPADGVRQPQSDPTR